MGNLLIQQLASVMPQAGFSLYFSIPFLLPSLYSFNNAVSQVSSGFSTLILFALNLNMGW